MPKHRYFLTRAAERDLGRISSVERQRIGQKLKYFISVGDPLVFATQLSGVKPTIYRFRIGKYRVFFDVKADTLRILNVSLRDKAYRK